MHFSARGFPVAKTSLSVAYPECVRPLARVSALWRAGRKRKLLSRLVAHIRFLSTYWLARGPQSARRSATCGVPSAVPWRSPQAVGYCRRRKVLGRAGDGWRGHRLSGPAGRAWRSRVSERLSPKYGAENCSAEIVGRGMPRGLLGLTEILGQSWKTSEPKRSLWSKQITIRLLCAYLRDDVEHAAWRPIKVNSDCCVSLASLASIFGWLSFLSQAR